VREFSRTDKTVAFAAIGVIVLANVILFGRGVFPVIREGVPDWVETFVIIAGVFMTFAMFSLLYKDNPFFRIVENLFVGMGLGVSLVVVWYNFMRPDVFDPLVRPLFVSPARVNPADLWLLVPIFLGVLVLTRISPRHMWISRYPMAFIVGYGMGFSIQPAIHSMIFKQLEVTMRPSPMHWAAWAGFGAVALLFIATAYVASRGGRLAFWLKVVCGVIAVGYVIARVTAYLQARAPVAAAFAGIDQIVLMVGVISVMCYFFFSAEHKGALGAVSRLGIIFLMVSFGASFGYTVMARESLLIGRFQFLLGDWLNLL